VDSSSIPIPEKTNLIDTSSLDNTIEFTFKIRFGHPARNSRILALLETATQTILFLLPDCVTVAETCWFKQGVK
jgi:hypothetical protein